MYLSVIIEKTGNVLSMLINLSWGDSYFHLFDITLRSIYDSSIYMEQNGISNESSDKKEIVAKNAKTDYPVSKLIAKRWSARAFSTRHVEKSKLLSVLEAARWAPSSRNEQPWRYIIFTNDNPETLKKAQSVLKEINDYAKRASILICAITKKYILIMEVRTGFIFMI